MNSTTFFYVTPYSLLEAIDVSGECTAHFFRVEVQKEKQLLRLRSSKIKIACVKKCKVMAVHWGAAT
jgi:hypothetical protein